MLLTRTFNLEALGYAAAALIATGVLVPLGPDCKADDSAATANAAVGSAWEMQMAAEDARYPARSGHN